jgi:outer membrane protein
MRTIRNLRVSMSGLFKKKCKVHKQPLAYFWLMLLLLLFFTELSASAQEVQQLTLREAVRLALQENIALKQVENQYQRSKIELRQARANLYPNLTASSSLSRDYPAQGISGQSFSASVGSSVNLFNGFSDMSNIQSAEYSMQADKASLARERESISFEIVNRYLQMVLDSAFIAIEQENLNSQQLQLQQIQEFQKAGNRSIADVYQQMADIKQSELQVLNAVSNYDISRLQVLQTLGQSAEQEIKFMAPPVALIATNLPRNLDSLTLQLAVSTRNDAEAQRQQINVAVAQIRNARSDYWPSLQLSVSERSSYSGHLNNVGFNDQFFNDNRSTGIGLSMNIPLFDRLLTKHNVQRARINYDDQNLKLKNLELQIGSELRQALLNYSTAVKQREVAQALFQFRDESLKISAERYRVGAITFVELSQIRANFVDASYQQISADYNLVLQYISVFYYYGNIDQSLVQMY